MIISGNVNYFYYKPGIAEKLVHRYRYNKENRMEIVQTSTDGYLVSTDVTYYYYKPAEEVGGADTVFDCTEKRN